MIDLRKGVDTSIRYSKHGFADLARQYREIS